MIDTQHQRLSNYANNLRATIFFERPVDEANAIIDAFIRDLVQHFQDEEAILAASNYICPNYSLYLGFVPGGLAIFLMTWSVMSILRLL